MPRYNVMYTKQLTSNAVLGSLASFLLHSWWLCVLQTQGVPAFIMPLLPPSQPLSRHLCEPAHLLISRASSFNISHCSGREFRNEDTRYNSPWYYSISHFSPISSSLLYSFIHLLKSYKVPATHSDRRWGNNSECVTISVPDLIDLTF